MNRPVLYIMLLLLSTPAFAGKLYKWVDKDGKVTFSQTPPTNVPAVRKTEKMNVSSTTLMPRKKRGRYYCGRDELPKLSGDAAYKISSLQNNIYNWEDAIERRQGERSEEMKRRYDSEGRFNEVLKRNSQNDYEDRCKIEWAKKQLSLLQGDKEKILRRHKDIKVAIKELEEGKLMECGTDERTGVIVVDDEYREYLNCVRGYDRELDRLKRELKRADRNRNMIDSY
jgi:hypothetical protein